MLTKWIGTAALAACLSASALAGGLGDNAALRYWRAWIFFNDADRQAVSEIGKQTIEESFDSIDTARELVARHEMVIETILEGAAIDECDFGVAYEKGFDALLPHLGPMRISLFLLLADARIRIEEGDSAGAADRLAAAYAMSEHAAHDNLLIGSLVSVSMFTMTDEVARIALDRGALTPDGMRRLREAVARFDRDDPFHTKQSINTERRIMLSWVRDKLHAPDAPNFLTEMIGPDDASDPAVGVMLANVADAAWVDRQVDLLDTFYMQVLAVWDGDPDAKALDALGEKARADEFGPLTKLIVPSLSNARRQDTKAQNRLRETRDMLGG